MRERVMAYVTASIRKVHEDKLALGESEVAYGLIRQRFTCADVQDKPKCGKKRNDLR
jgi:hypothetical protein